MTKILLSKRASSIDPSEPLQKKKVRKEGDVKIGPDKTRVRYNLAKIKIISMKHVQDETRGRLNPVQKIIRS